MTTSAVQCLCVALKSDLKKSGATKLGKVVNDHPRKRFTANIDGAVLEFAHRQPDAAFWSGVKYYASGANNRIRIVRTPPIAAE
jgi:hypothetical protein